MRQVLLFADNGSAEIRTIFIDDEGKCSGVVDMRSKYRIEADKILFSDLGGETLEWSYWFDKQSRLVIRYKDEVELKHVRLAK